MRKPLSTVSAILVFGFVLALVLWGLVVLPEYWTQLAVGLTLLGMGILYWGWRPEINRLVRRRSKGPKLRLSPVSDMLTGETRFDMMVVANDPIRPLEVQIAYGYGAPTDWANLDLREVQSSMERVPGNAVRQRQLERHGMTRFVMLTCWARDHRASIRTAESRAPDLFTNIRFLSRFPEVYVRFVGLAAETEKKYVVVFNNPPWNTQGHPVDLFDIESELGRKIVANRERLAGRRPSEPKLTAHAPRKEGWVDVFMTRQVSTSTRQEVLVPF